MEKVMTRNQNCAVITEAGVGVNMERIMCATCKHRGTTLDTRDESGIQHCTLLSRNDEILCIARNHQQWEMALTIGEAQEIEEE